MEERLTWGTIEKRVVNLENIIDSIETWKNETESGLNEMKSIKKGMYSGTWTPVVSGAASYDYRNGTYVVIGNVVILAFTAVGQFADDASSETIIQIMGAPQIPAKESGGGGNISGYYAENNMVFSGWTIGTSTQIQPITQEAAPGGTREAGVAKKSASASFRMSGTIMYRKKE